VANILVYIELVGNEASEPSLRALNRGREVASTLGATLYALLPCADTPSYDDEDIIAVLSRYGADKVILISHPRLGPPAFYATHGEALLAACRQFPPKLLLFPVSAEGRELAPRLAIALRSVYVADAALEFDGAGFLVSRLIFRRQYVTREPLSSFERPVVMTLAGNDPPKAMGDDEAEVVVIHAPVDPSPPLEVLEGPTLPTSPSLHADRVVGGGAGLGPDAFENLARLAQTIEGGVAASATACAKGLASPELRVGLDGSGLESELYLAFGISGSERHLAALAPHTEVAAINSNPAAPIFDVARHKLVADAEKILRELLEHLAEQRRSAT
jgi:electron transfer flavoprotein alpha subunit